MTASANPAAPQTPGIAVLEERRKPDSLMKIAGRRFLRHRMAVFGVILMGLIMAYVTVPAFFFTEDFANNVDVSRRFQAPSAEHLFGTDEVGRDVFVRTVWGGQISLAIGITSVLISITLGTLVGLAAGYFGGWIDSLLMRFVEAMLSIPTLILLLMLQRVLIGNTATMNVLGRQISVTVVAIVLIIGLTGWMGLSRIVRSMVLSLKEQEFVVAARTLGANNLRIIFVHILPNTIAPIVVSATLAVGGAIIIETALGFLGFGVQPPTATWGNILSRARERMNDVWWLWLAPGVLIMLTVLAINFIGDGLRDAFDPRSKQ
jgi:peptide/nickel transport system permease protein